jgi:excisionase family DNA binding protein
MVYRSRKFFEGNPHFARDEAPRLDSSKTAVAVASNVSAEEDQRSPREQTSRFGSLKSAPGAPLNSGLVFDDSNPPLRSLKPLAVSVPTAATLLGVGTTTVWDLIRRRRIDVIRIGRRTLPTMASLERLVADAGAFSRQAPGGAP